MKDLISVVVPIYNVEKYLAKCVDSIINQTYSNLQIILVDDGSPDTCGKICDDYEKKDSRITVIHKKNGGLSDARNAGIDVSKGKYITFIDSDDYISNDYIMYLYNNIKKFNGDVSIGDMNICFTEESIINNIIKDKITEKTKGEFLEEMLYGGAYYISACSKLYSTDLFDNIRFPVGKIHEDIWTIYKVYDSSKKIICGHKKIYNYMIRNNSITNSNFTERDMDLIYATDAMCEYLSKYKFLDKAIGRRKVYSRISLLCKRNVPKLIEDETIKYVKENKKSIFYSKASIRDKIATFLIVINIKVFKFFWKCYCKLTNRVI